MSLIMIAFLALFIPGLIMIALVVAVALPRALRDLKEQQRRRDGEPPVSDDPPDT
jgi:hypothetical protein